MTKTSVAAGMAIVILAFSQAGVMSSEAEKKELFSNPGALINTGAAGASQSIFNKTGVKTQTSSAGGADQDVISTDMIRCETERDMLYVTLSNKGLACMQEGRYDDAVKTLKEAVGIRPDLPYAYINLANAYHHFGKYDLAITTSQFVIRMSPRDGNAYGIIGNAYQSLGKNDVAREYYQKALELFTKQGNAEAVEKVRKYIAELSQNN